MRVTGTEMHVNKYRTGSNKGTHGAESMLEPLSPDPFFSSLEPKKSTRFSSTSDSYAQKVKQNAAIKLGEAMHTYHQQEILAGILQGDISTQKNDEDKLH